MIMRKISISTIMTHQVVFLNQGDHIKKADTLFKQYNIRHIPVVSGGVLLGLLSSTDLDRINFDEALYEKSEAVKAVERDFFTVEQVMTKKVITVNTSNTIMEVAKIFATKEYHALPVVVNDNQLVGIVTTTDILNYMLKQF